jgi:hypothetical protein
MADDIPTLSRAICDGRNMAEYLSLGWYWTRRVRRMQVLSGTYQAARNLRKQGVDFHVARMLLLQRRTDGR